MKLFAFGILSLLFIISSCGESPNSKEVVKLDEQVSDSQPKKDLVGEYKVFVEGLDSNDVKSIALATEKYKELFKNADEQSCDTAFLVFHHLYEGMTYILNEDVMNNVALQETVWIAFDENGKKLPMPKAYIKEENKVKSYGYQLEFPEGMICIGYDRSYIVKHFYDFVSPTMKSFLKQLDHDNENKFAGDAAIMVDEKEYVDRLIWYENFEKKNPEFLMKDRVKATRQQLFVFFLIGMDNTPVIDYGTDEISEYLKMPMRYWNGIILIQKHGKERNLINKLCW